MSPRTPALVLALALAAGCGGSNPEPTTPAPEASAAPVAKPEPAPSATAAAVAADDGKAAPREAPTLATTVGDDALLVVALDAKALRAAPLWALAMDAVKKGGGEVVGGEMDRWQKACGFSPLEAIDEAVASGRPGSIVIALKPSQSPDAILACVAKLVPGAEETNLGGRRAIALRGGPKAVATSAGFVLVGDDGAVKDALGRVERGAPRSAASRMLDQRKDATLFLHASPPDDSIKGVNAWLRASTSEFTLHIDVDAASPDVAAALAKQADAVLKDAREEAAKTGAPKADVEAILGSLKVKADGARLVADAGVKGDVAAQTKYIGSMAALATAGVKQYMADAKTSEARATVHAIARGLVSASEREEVDAKGKPVTKHRFPPSAPATPKAVPKGTVVQTSDKDWSHPSWKAIAFNISGMPTRYSYDFVTAPDGQKATVHARGDLDGDGKTSLFELEVKLGKDGPQIGSMKVKDGAE